MRNALYGVDFIFRFCTKIKFEEIEPGKLDLYNRDILYEHKRITRNNLTIVKTKTKLVRKIKAVRNGNPEMTI